MRSRLVRLACFGIGLAAAAPAAGQQRPSKNPHLKPLLQGFRVQLRVRHVDSTLWFSGRLSQTREGCTYVEIENGRWRDGTLVPDSGVPARERVATPPYRVRRVGFHPDSTSGSWGPVEVERLLEGEPEGCRPAAGGKVRGPSR